MTLAGPELLRAVRAEQAARLAVRNRLLTYATTLWGGMGSWRDADVDRFVERIVPTVLAGRTRVAQITDTYISQVTGERGGDLIDVASLRGAEAGDVYRRPATTMYTELSKGKTLEAAKAAATARLVDIVKTDLQLSMSRQAQRSMAPKRSVEAFARTLTGAENCGLCVIASTQRYWKKDLLPIHPGCDCGVVSLGRGDHFEQVIDPGLLEATHAEIEKAIGHRDHGARDLGLGKADAQGNDLSDFTDLIITREHGEYGPTLTWRHQSFTGPSDI